MIGDLPQQPKRSGLLLPRTITIVVHPDGACDVHEGEHFAHGLVWDELLGEIGRLTSFAFGYRGRYMQHVDKRLDWLTRARP